MKPAQPRQGLRLVALFEAGKGALVLLAGCGLLRYIHRDLHAGAERLVRHFHLNPASRYPRIFLDLADHINDVQLWTMALFALCYAGIRFAEAYGLWKERHWAQWLGFASGSIYLPLELFEITRGVSWPKLSLLVVNAAIVSYLSIVLLAGRRHRSGPAL